MCIDQNNVLFVSLMGTKLNRNNIQSITKEDGIYKDGIFCRDRRISSTALAAESWCKAGRATGYHFMTPQGQS